MEIFIILNEYLTAAEIIELRDLKLIEYHNDKSFLNSIEKKFGISAKKILKKKLR